MNLMIDDNIIPFPPIPTDIVWSCGECGGETFILYVNGILQCDDCENAIYIEDLLYGEDIED